MVLWRWRSLTSTLSRSPGSRRAAVRERVAGDDGARQERVADHGADVEVHALLGIVIVPRVVPGCSIVLPVIVVLIVPLWGVAPPPARTSMPKLL